MAKVRKQRRARVEKTLVKRTPKPTIAECGHVIHIPGSENSGNIAVWYLCDKAGRRIGKATMNAETCDALMKSGELIDPREDDLTGGTIYVYAPLVKLATPNS